MATVTSGDAAPPYLVGVDCGTQSAKVVIYDARGDAVAEGRQPLRPTSRPRHGIVVHPDEDLWDAIGAASRRALAAFPGDPAGIAAVGLCGIRCCKAFLREDGSLAEPVISWMDERAYQPYVPDDPTVRFATTSSGYLAHRFTGKLKETAANDIALQWPIDTDTWRWSDDDEVVGRYGIPRRWLVELQMPGDVIGPLSPKAAAHTAIPAGVPVVQTANDKAVEALGSGSLGPATALVSLGTYICAMVHGHENHPSPTHFWTNFACIPHRYLYESSGVRRGMWTLTWFLDLLGEEVAERAAAEGLARERYIEREAERVPAGSDGLMTVLDWLAPTDVPYRKGVMIGFDARHTRGHVFRSIVEAIALTMKTNVDAMCAELGIALEDIVVSGGGSSSTLFMQVLADVFGIPAARVAGNGGASLGAAICAAAAAGLYPDIESAAAAMTKEREHFLPDAASTEIYRRVNETVYGNIRNATDALLEQSFPIFH